MFLAAWNSSSRCYFVIFVFCHFNPLSARIFTVFGHSLLEDRVLHKEAWVVMLLGTHLSIQVHKKVKFSLRDNSSFAVNVLKVMNILIKVKTIFCFDIWVYPCYVENFVLLHDIFFFSTRCCFHNERLIDVVKMSLDLHLLPITTCSDTSMNLLLNKLWTIRNSLNTQNHVYWFMYFVTSS